MKVLKRESQISFRGLAFFAFIYIMRILAPVACLCVFSLPVGLLKNELLPVHYKGCGSEGNFNGFETGRSETEL